MIEIVRQPAAQLRNRLSYLSIFLVRRLAFLLSLLQGLLSWSFFFWFVKNTYRNNMSVKEKQKLLANLPMLWHRKSPPAESATKEQPQLLDVSVMKTRPRKQNSAHTLRPARSAPSLNELLEEPPHRVEDKPSGPGKISIQELRNLAQKEKEKEEKQKEKDKLLVVASTSSALGASSSNSSPRHPSKIDELLAMNAQFLKDSPPKLVVPVVEKTAKKKKKKGSRKLAKSMSDTASSSVRPELEGDSPVKDMEEEDEEGSEGQGGAAQPLSPSTAAGQKKHRKKRKPAATTGWKRQVAELEKQLAEAKAALEREVHRRQATDQILSKMLASKNDDALNSNCFFFFFTKWFLFSLSNRCCGSMASGY
jgi:hypothetical protein